MATTASANTARYGLSFSRQHSIEQNLKRSTNIRESENGSWPVNWTLTRGRKEAIETAGNLAIPENTGSADPPADT
jgi:hypothetical protein